MECLDPYRPKRSQGIWVEYVRTEMAIYDLNLENARQALQSAFENCNFNLDDFTDKDR